MKNRFLKRLAQIVLLSAAAVIAVNLIKTFGDISELNASIEEKRSYIRSLEADRAELLDLLSADEQDLVERYARQENLSFPGELIYNDITVKNRKGKS